MNLSESIGRVEQRVLAETGGFYLLFLVSRTKLPETMLTKLPDGFRKKISKTLPFRLILITKLIATKRGLEGYLLKQPNPFLSLLCDDTDIKEAIVGFS